MQHHVSIRLRASGHPAAVSNERYTSAYSPAYSPALQLPLHCRRQFGDGAPSAAHLRISAHLISLLSRDAPRREARAAAVFRCLQPPGVAVLPGYVPYNGPLCVGMMQSSSIAAILFWNIVRHLAPLDLACTHSSRAPVGEPTAVQVAGRSDASA